MKISRRRFISSCSKCAACLAIAPAALVNPSCSRVAAKKDKKIRIVYAAVSADVSTQPFWPHVGFDFRPVMEKMNEALKAKGIAFVTALATGQADAEKLVQQDRDNDIGGYIVYQMSLGSDIIQTMAMTGKPVLFVDFKYGGGDFFLAANAFLMSTGKFRNVGFVSSSRMDDMLAAVDCLSAAIRNESPVQYGAAAAETRRRLTPAPRKQNPVVDKLQLLSPADCIDRLRKSKIIAVSDQAPRFLPAFGIGLECIPFAKLNEAWKGADKDEAEAIAKRWQRTALDVTDVTHDTLKSSAAMYLGMKSILKAYGAKAITINCLGGFYGGYIPAYPCLGFHELNNEGFVGACEGDVLSATTMLAFSTMSHGRPGYISDPVIDTAKRQIIYAHCVASNRVFGPRGAVNPIKIMTHSEDRKGASVRSILPVNYLTTTLQIHTERKEIILHQAIAVDNDPDDRACRTKLCAEPLGDMEKLFTMWHNWGWHRVTFYGDLKAAAYALADIMKWKVIEEA